MVRQLSSSCLFSGCVLGVKSPDSPNVHELGENPQQQKTWNLMFTNRDFYDGHDESLMMIMILCLVRRGICERLIQKQMPSHWSSHLYTLTSTIPSGWVVTRSSRPTSCPRRGQRPRPGLFERRPLRAAAQKPSDRTNVFCWGATRSI